ncbi:MAG: TorF family putative porin [Betaproteobacteria bacterium]
MRNTLVALSLAAATGLPGVVSAQTAAPAAAPSDHTFTGNVGLFSEYRFRGIAQTFAKPAIQGGFDYAHSSGLYLGNWNSNVSSGAGFPAGNIEMDLYGGWKKSWNDWGLDVGFIYYYYPGSDANAASGTTLVNPRTPTRTYNGTIDNKEIYIGGSWKWLSAKYYYSVDDYFSQPGTKGSNYLDVSATYDLGGGWGLVGHVGSFRLKGWNTAADVTKANYTDYKLGVTKDMSGWVFGASYIDTTAKGSCNAANPGYYCFANALPAGAGAKFKDAGKGVVVLSVSKSF